MSIWLHVSSGSLNETDATRGLAHYLEHMAFNGSANFPPGSVVPFFQSLGLAFGRDQNAFTSFDQTTYQLTLPGSGKDALDKGMLFMSDVATRLSLATPEIDGERQIILEEKRSRSSARQRVQDQVLRAAGARVDARPPPADRRGGDHQGGRARRLRGLLLALVRAEQHDRDRRGRHRPGAGGRPDQRDFGGGPTVPRPAPRDVGVKATAGPRAIVVTDPELTRSEVSIVRIEPPRAARDDGRAATARDGRSHRRLDVQPADERRARGGQGGLPRRRRLRLRLAGNDAHDRGRASGRPGTWRAMLTDLGTALQRARLHGFSEREVEDARQALIGQAEEAVQREATRPARDVLRQINGAVTRQQPIMSAAQSPGAPARHAAGHDGRRGLGGLRSELRPGPGDVHRRAARERRHPDGGRAAGARPRGRRGHAGQGGGGRESDGAADHAAQGRHRRRGAGRMPRAA